MPPDRLTQAPIIVLPETCPCGHIFPNEAPTTGTRWRHQIFDILPITPSITKV